MAINGQNNLGRIDTKLSGGGINDPLIGLMRHNPVDIGFRHIGPGNGILGDFSQIRDGMLENFLAEHSQQAGFLIGRRTTIHIKQVMVPAVGPQCRRNDPGIVGPSLTCGQDNGTGTVAKQDTGAAVFPN